MSKNPVSRVTYPFLFLSFSFTSIHTTIIPIREARPLWGFVLYSEKIPWITLIWFPLFYLGIAVSTVYSNIFNHTLYIPLMHRYKKQILCWLNSSDISRVRSAENLVPSELRITSQIFTKYHLTFPRPYHYSVISCYHNFGPNLQLGKIRFYIAFT